MELRTCEGGRAMGRTDEQSGVDAVRAARMKGDDRTTTVFAAEVKEDAVRAAEIKGTRDEGGTRNARR